MDVNKSYEKKTSRYKLLVGINFIFNNFYIQKWPSLKQMCK